MAKQRITPTMAEGLRFGFIRAGATLSQAQVILVDLANTIGDDPRRVKRLVLGGAAEMEDGHYAVTAYDLGPWPRGRVQPK